MTFTEWIAEVDRALRAAWSEYHVAVLTLAGVAGLLILLVLLAVAKIRKRRVRPTLVFIGANLGLLLNAEGMWVVLTEKAGVPHGFAVLVFAVFEIALLIAMDQASARWLATAVRYTRPETDAEGRKHRVGEIKRAGSAGSALAVVWFVALLSGAIVATNGGSVTTVLLRLGLPVVIVLLWWITRTAEVATLRRRTTFRYHPYRIGVRRGWWAPEEADDGTEDRMRAEAAHSTERRLATLGRRIDSGVPPAWLWKWRVSRLALDVDEATVTAAAAKVARARSAVARLTGRQGGPDRTQHPLGVDDSTSGSSKPGRGWLPRTLAGGRAEPHATVPTNPSRIAAPLPDNPPDRAHPVPDPQPDNVPERTSPGVPAEPAPADPVEPDGSAGTPAGAVRAPAVRPARKQSGGGVSATVGKDARSGTGERTRRRATPEEQAEAMAAWRASGGVISGRQLARRFPAVSERWAQRWITAEMARVGDPPAAHDEAAASPNGKVSTS